MSKGKLGLGRIVAGVLLGALLAIITPIMLLVELLSPTTAVLLPSVGLIALARWSGRATALSCAVLTLFTSAFFGGVPVMLIVLILSVLPPLLLLRWQDKPFFEQLRISIAIFGAGVLAAVAVIFFNFGGNLIERALGQFPDMVRALPADYVAPMLEYMSSILGRSITLDSFYEIYDSMIEGMIPLYQMLLPQRLFSGALMSALLCVWLSNRMRAKRGLAAPGSYVPLRGWALPASTTGGLLLLLLVSWVLTLTKFGGAETVYYAVYGIASVAFSVQTLGSAARRLHATSMRPGTQRALLVMIALLGTLLLPDAMMVYGGASAIFGSRGVVVQRRQNQSDDGRFGGDQN